MKLNTASSAISFAKKLEDDSAALYEELAKKYPQGREMFLSCVKENKRCKTLVDRVYYGVITDAIEGAFSFEGIESDDFAVEARFPQDASYQDALRMLIAMEEKIAEFYRVASEASRSLMADIPRAFDNVVRRRGQRIEKLRSLLAAAQ